MSEFVPISEYENVVITETEIGSVQNPKIIRPYERLPVPFPAEYDPGENDPGYFYRNFIKHFIPDMIQMMSTGLTIDDAAVEKLRITIDEVLVTVEKRLEVNPIIKEYQQWRRPAAQKAHEEKATQAVRSLDYYLREYNPKDMVHRTWVVNCYLSFRGKEADHREKWTIKALKEYLPFCHNDPFIRAMSQSRRISDNPHVLYGMRELAKYKLDLWNRPRYEEAKKKVTLPPFNPGSSKQMRELFEMLKIAPLAYSKETGEPSWGRDQLEELQHVTTDPDLLDTLEAFIDFSYSAIIKSNFLKAFDSFTIDGVLHGNIKLFGAKSFRNTSNSPNLLNAPSTGSIYAEPLKRCFIAPSGFIVFTADLDGLEDRGIANLSGDTNKKAVFLEDLDGHSLAATYYFKDRLRDLIGDYSDHKETSRLLKNLVDKKDLIAKHIRQDGKPVSFGLAYGAYPPKVAATIKCALEEAERIFNVYHYELYPGITAYREDYVLPTAHEQGYIHLGLGCRMYTSDAGNHIRTLSNATVQFWSILTLIAINEFNHRIREERLEKEVQVTSTIYDSIYGQALIDADILAWVNSNLIELMTVQWLEKEDVHNLADLEIGVNWADIHKVKNNATPAEIQAILETIYG